MNAIANNDLFPRLGGVQNGGSHDYANPTYQAQLAKLDLVVVGIWPGWNTKTRTLEACIKAIKAINPKTKVYQYINVMEVDTSSAAYKPMSTQCETNKWWLYGSGGERLLSEYGVQTSKPVYQINYLNKAESDWHANWVVDTFIKPNPSLDGFFEDNVFWQPRVAGDWNRDGTVESPSTVSSLHRAAYRSRFDLLQSLIGPNRSMIGNIADWGRKESVLTELSGSLAGGVIEGLLGVSYSPETWGSWTEMMRWYRKTIANLADPKYAIFHATGTADDYQGLRYGLGSCLLDNGYFAYTDKDNGYSSVAWFDEFDINLGKATSLPPSTAYQNGVWRRDFENGVALVNPKGNGSQTVSLEPGLRRFKGTQDPQTNNGQSVTKVTLADRDGLILVKANTPKAPNLKAV